MMHWKKAIALIIIGTLAGCATLSSENRRSAVDTLLDTQLPEADSSVPFLAEGNLVLEIHALINGMRSEHGLTPLSWEPQLAFLARQHSVDMAKRGFFSHVNPDGLDPTDRARSQGLEPTRVRLNTVITGIGENLFLGHRFSAYWKFTESNGDIHYEFDWMTTDELAERVVEEWYRSEPHRANLLSDLYLSHGIGVVAGPNGTVFLTENLSPTRTASPAIASHR